MKTKEDIEKRITLNYLQEHNYNTGLTPEEFLTLIDDPDIKYELEEWFERCENLNVPTTSNDGMAYDPEFAELLHESAQHWREENIEEATKYDKIMDEHFELLHEQPQKKSQIQNKIENESIKILPFELRMVYYPYFDSVDTYEYHPTFMMPTVLTDRTIEYRFVFVTSGKKTNPIFRVYETAITDWKKCGLKHISFARMDKTCINKRIVFIEQSKKVRGTLSKHTIHFCLKQRNYFLADCFKHPVAFMGWLIENEIGDTIPVDGINNNMNQPQTIFDIRESKTANCVDIAFAAFEMCGRCDDINSTQLAEVIWTIGPNKTKSHVFTMFEYRRHKYVFDYDQINKIGTFRIFNRDKDYYTVATEFSNMIRIQAHDNELTHLNPEDQKIYLLNKAQMNNIGIKQYQTQKELLQLFKQVKVNESCNIEMMLHVKDIKNME